MPYTDPKERRQYFRERHLKMMSWALSYHGNRCRCCGSDQRLELHHRDPSIKKLNISKMTHHSLILFETEVKKCLLLCCDCHTFQRRSVNHGLTRYSHYGCRCLTCRTSWNEYHQKRRLSLNGKTANR